LKKLNLNLVKQLTTQWSESTQKVIEKKMRLETMLDDSRHLDKLNSEFSDRVGEIEQKMQGLPEPSLGKDTLKRQKTEYKVR
jgi:hypothetical protein